MAKRAVEKEQQYWCKYANLVKLVWKVAAVSREWQDRKLNRER